MTKRIVEIPLTLELLVDLMNQFGLQVERDYITNEAKRAEIERITTEWLTPQVGQTVNVLFLAALRLAVGLGDLLIDECKHHHEVKP